MSFARKDYADWTLLGEGGEARVFRARQVATNRVVAIRELHSHAVARAERAARTFTSLRHAGLALLLDSGAEDGRFYLVQDYVAGASLAELAPLPLPVALALMRALVQTLAYLHAQGLVHGDLHPGNVLATTPDRCVLVDLGSVRLQGTPPESVLGAPRYFSPEHVQGAPLDTRSDIFACGSLLYYMVSGQDLFTANRFEELATALHDLQSPTGSSALALRWRDLPAELWPVLDRCLRYTASERCEDMEELDELLEIALGQFSARHGLSSVRGAQAMVRDRIATACAQEEAAHVPPPASTGLPRARAPFGRFALAFVLGAVALFALVWWLWLAPPVDSKLDAIGATLVAESRTPDWNSAPTATLRLIPVPDAEQFQGVWIDSLPLPPGTDLLRLAPGKHRFRGQLQGGNRWKTATLQVPAQGSAIWNWDSPSTPRPYER